MSQYSDRADVAHSGRLNREQTAQALFFAATSAETLRHAAQIAFVEKEPEHVLLDHVLRARVTAVESVFVDDHRQALEPLVPARLGYVLVDALAEHFRELGLAEAELLRLFRSYNASAPAFEEESRHHE